MENDEDEELFDLFLINEHERNENTDKNGGGCLGYVLLMIAVPVLLSLGVAIVV